MSRELVMFGTAEMASLAKFYFTHDSEFEVVAFTVDDEHIEADHCEGLPVVPFSEIKQRFPPASHHMHVALSYTRLNRLREEKYRQAKEAGYRLASYLCSKSTYWPDLVIGDNCLILEDQTLQPTVRIGNDVILWSGNHIGHGSTIGDHTFFSSQIVVSGHCTIGERCFVGVNATLKDFTTVGDDSFITMDCSITRDVPAEAVVLGTPCTVLEGDDRRAVKIRKSYFNL